MYRWWRNDKQVKEGEESILTLMGFNRKDVVVVEVIARDQEAAALPVRSAPIVLGNSSPQIVSNPAGTHRIEHDMNTWSKPRMSMETVSAMD